MDWSHSPQASQQHYTTNLNVESEVETEKSTTEKHMAPRSGSRRQRNLLHLETVGEIGSGPSAEGATKVLIDWLIDWLHCTALCCSALAIHTRNIFNSNLTLLHLSKIIEIVFSVDPAIWWTLVITVGLILHVRYIRTVAIIERTFEQLYGKKLPIIVYRKFIKYAYAQIYILCITKVSDTMPNITRQNETESKKCVKHSISNYSAKKTCSDGIQLSSPLKTAHKFITFVTIYVLVFINIFFSWQYTIYKLRWQRCLVSVSNRMIRPFFSIQVTLLNVFGYWSVVFNLDAKNAKDYEKCAAYENDVSNRSQRWKKSLNDEFQSRSSTDDPAFKKTANQYHVFYLILNYLRRN